MSLQGFSARNHPQQTATGNGDAERDERYTPLAMIERLHAEWRFTVDAAGTAAAPASQVIGWYWTRADDGLAQPWDGERVWCNPPFSNVSAWVAKAWASRAVVVMLLPANRTEQPWWQKMVEPFRDQPGSVLRTRFEPKRIQFCTPEFPDGKQWRSSPPFGCVLLMWTSPVRTHQHTFPGMP